MDIEIIKNRRAELERENALYEEKTAANNVELGELDIAERVFSRLSDSQSVKPVARVRKRVRPKSTKKGTVRQLILEALMDARQQDLPGLAPRGIRAYVLATYGRKLGPQANTVASRLWREGGEIDKDEATGLFSIPHKREDADDNLSGNTSAPSSFETPAQGREAGPGGGP